MLRRRLRLLVTVFGLALPACRPCPPDAPSSPPGSEPAVEPAVAPASTASASVRAEIEARNRELEQAYAQGDMKAVAMIYADDAIMLSPGSRRWSGRAEIDEYWARFHSPIEWTLEVQQVDGNETLAIQRGRSILVYGKDDGQPQRSEVEFMLIWQRETPGDAKSPWRIAVDAYW